MPEYFRLFPDALHHSGPAGAGLITLLADEGLLRLPPAVNAVVEMSRAGKSLAEIVVETGSPEADIAAIIDMLVAEGAGERFPVPVFVEHLRQPDYVSDSIGTDMPKLRIRLSGRCGGACSFCRSGQPRPSMRPCDGCQRTDEPGRDLPMATVEWFLDQATGAGCQTVMFDAPDPDAIAETLKSAVACARSKGLAVETRCGLLPSPELLAHLGEAGVTPVFQLFSLRAGEHDRVRGMPGDFDRLVAATRSLRNAGRPFGLLFLRCLADEDFGAIREGLRGFGASALIVDSLRTLPFDEASFFDWGADPPGYILYNRRMNTPICQWAVGTLDSDGRYRTCPAGRDEGTGAYGDGRTLRETLSPQAIQESWKRLALKATPCKDCDLTAVCSLCRVPEGAASHPVCGYDVTKNRWAAPAV